VERVLIAVGLIFCLVAASCSSGTYLTPYTPNTSPSTSTYLPPQTTTAKPPTTSANAEKTAILAFTRQALEIEGKRDALVNCYAGLFMPFEKEDFKDLLGSSALIMSQTFLTGISPNVYAGIEIPPSGLEGMTSLRQKMILLSCPQSMQSIKDALVSIYTSEVARGLPFYATDVRWGSGVIPDSGYVAVSMDNLDYWVQLLQLVQPLVQPGGVYSPWGATTPDVSYLNSVINSDWYKLQSFRRDTYIQWSQLLKQHGVDSAFVDASIK
jgi:hypothetical protein